MLKKKHNKITHLKKHNKMKTCQFRFEYQHTHYTIFTRFIDFTLSENFMLKQERKKKKNGMCVCYHGTYTNRIIWFVLWPVIFITIAKYVAEFYLMQWERKKTISVLIMVSFSWLSTDIERASSVCALRLLKVCRRT